VLDAALSLNNTSTSIKSCVASATRYLPPAPQPADDAFRARFAALDAASRSLRIRARPVRPCRAPERDLLWFIATYAPEMESWNANLSGRARRVVLFYPCRHRDHDEGWASYWHARLLREADFIRRPRTSMQSSAIRTSCAIAAGEQVALTVIHHLGFTLWRRS